MLQTLFTSFLTYGISRKKCSLWKHPPDEGLPGLKCFIKVGQNYVIINKPTYSKDMIGIQNFLHPRKT